MFILPLIRTFTTGQDRLDLLFLLVDETNFEISFDFCIPLRFLKRSFLAITNTTTHDL